MMLITAGKNLLIDWYRSLQADFALFTGPFQLDIHSCLRLLGNFDRLKSMLSLVIGVPYHQPEHVQAEIRFCGVRSMQ